MIPITSGFLHKEIKTIKIIRNCLSLNSKTKSSPYKKISANSTPYFRLYENTQITSSSSQNNALFATKWRSLLNSHTHTHTPRSPYTRTIPGQRGISVSSSGSRSSALPIVCVLACKCNYNVASRTRVVLLAAMRSLGRADLIYYSRPAGVGRRSRMIERLVDSPGEGQRESESRERIM